MKSFLEEFKGFAIRGNVVDLAVAVIIGTAFGKIASSLVDTVIMPTLGVFLGGVNFTGWSFTLGESTIAYGQFIQSIVDFFIIAFVIFMVVRMISNMKKKHESTAITSIEPSEEVLLLREIRDSLKK